MVFTDSKVTAEKCVADHGKGREMKLGVLGSPRLGSMIVSRPPTPLKSSFTPTEAWVPCLALMGIANIYMSVVSTAQVCTARRSEQPSNYYIWFSVIDSVAIVRAGRSLFLKKAVPLRSSMCG